MCHACLFPLAEILNSWGPLLAALITGWIALSVAREQQKTTLDVMRSTLANERMSRKQEALRGPIHDLLAQLYFAKHQKAYEQRAILHAIAKVDLSLVEVSSAAEYDKLLTEIARAVLSGFDANTNDVFIERVRDLGRRSLH